MCLIAFDWQPDSDKPLVMVANRDEYFNRPTRYMDQWNNQPGIIAGQDLKASGTWLGVNTNTGHFAALTNIRHPRYRVPGVLSRGSLVAGFLTTGLSADQYCRQVYQDRTRYSGFNLLLFDGREMKYVSSECPPLAISQGIHGLSNAGLDSNDWPKVVSARTKLSHWMEMAEDTNSLASLLNSRELASPTDLPETGIERTIEHLLSAEFIQMEGYGTRCSTGLIWQRECVEITEISYDPHGNILNTTRFNRLISRD
ncbi:NRDE family protein [Gynuella sp.]|uniref:NRDE family protein n=1 Tax=Gynuella sp. TaxID=2969146 RepID=UPI003D0DE959